MSPAAALLLAAVPAFVLGVVWSVVAAARLLFPERPLPLLPDPKAARRAAAAQGRAVPVGFREIHEDLREHARGAALPRRHPVGGLPGTAEPWEEDLWRRRN